MNNKSTVAVIVVLVVIVAAFFLIRGNSSTSDILPAPDTSGVDQGASSAAPGATVPAATSTAAEGKVVNITVTGSSFKFDPKTISVSKGDTVNVHFVNADGFHDFVIDEFNVRTPRISSGQSADVSFVADKTGSFVYYCSVGTHRQMGMWGTLTVN